MHANMHTQLRGSLLAIDIVRRSGQLRATRLSSLGYSLVVEFIILLQSKHIADNWQQTGCNQVHASGERYIRAAAELDERLRGC